MGAFDGYWVPNHGVIQKYNKIEVREHPRYHSGYYVSRDGINGGCTGEWRNTQIEADTLFDRWVSEGKTNVACWYGDKKIGNICEMHITKREKGK